MPDRTTPSTLAATAWSHAVDAAALLGMTLRRPSKGTALRALRRVEAALQADDVPVAARLAWSEARRCWWAMALTVSRLAEREARRNAGPLSYTDALQEGMIGAYEAARRFDPSRGIQYTTYARWWIRAAITRAVDNTGRPVRASSAATWVLINARNCRGTTDAEVAAELEISVARLHEARAVMQVCSLDQPTGLCPDTTYGDSLATDAPDEESRIDAARCVVAMREALGELPERQRVAVTRLLREDAAGRAETLTAVGQHLGVSRERARQLEAAGRETVRARVGGGR